jgi:hypothetical protein
MKGCALLPVSAIQMATKIDNICVVLHCAIQKLRVLICCLSVAAVVSNHLHLYLVGVALASFKLAQVVANGSSKLASNC